MTVLTSINRVDLRRRGQAESGVIGSASAQPDQPPIWATAVAGSLAKLLADLADLSANVLKVGHERLAPALHVDEVEVVLQVETRGPEHCAEVIAALRAVGYTLAFA
jgi:hypothetical protein